MEDCIMMEKYKLSTDVWLEPRNHSNKEIS